MNRKQTQVRKESKAKGTYLGLGLEHDYGRVTDAKIYSIVSTSDDCFVSDVKGRLRQYSLIDHS